MSPLAAAMRPLIDVAAARVVELRRAAAYADDRMAPLLEQEAECVERLAAAGRAALDTPPARCPDDRTPAGTSAVSPETNLPDSEGLPR